MPSYGDAGRLAKVDQAIAAIEPMLDRHVAALVLAIRVRGYEAAIADYFFPVVLHQSPDATAALSAVAVARLAP